ncbi:S9 family peptidase, partial [Streptomyces rhizosphaerihabitans]|uniref:S9 family peptidase n=1 Tax=Streptomyces rhizosphaerihabitans TaxID=1266770 RepID=UPI0021C0A439
MTPGPPATTPTAPATEPAAPATTPIAPATEPRSPGMPLAEALCTEPRPTDVAAYGDDGLLLRVDVPTRHGAEQPHLVHYRRRPDGTWEPTWTIPWCTQALPVPGGYVCVRRAQGRTLVELRPADGSPERVLLTTRGRVGALAPRPGGHQIAVTTSTFGGPGEHPGNLLAGSDAVWATGSDMTLSHAKQPQGAWQVHLVPLDGTAPHLLTPTVPADLALTGESAWAGAATLLLGAHRHHRHGVRNFGLLALAADSGDATRELFSATVDVCYPVQGPDGQVAYLATTLRRDNEPVAQHACLVGEDLREPLLLPADDGLWQRPIGWDGPRRLVCTAESGPRRRLYVHDLDHATWQPVPLTASVMNARVHTGRAAVLTSAPDTPPALQVTPLKTAGPQATGPHPHTAEHVVRAQTPPLPGRLHYRPQTIPGAHGDVASWVCLPEQDPPRGTVVLYHGGPFKSWSDWSWRWNPWPFVACGLAVVLVEPPMSLGYPDAVRTGWRQWRGGTAACAAAQVEAVRAAHGLLDSPLALMGGSFGGYLALNTAETLNPDLVVAHAAPLDLTQVAEGSDVGWQWIREFGDPTEWRPLYQLNSLFPRAVRPATRVLLSHGLHDGLVPPTETLRTHRALARQGVRSEVAFFRSEAHALSRPGNIRAWYRWVLAAVADELTPAPVSAAVTGEPAPVPASVPVSVGEPAPARTHPRTEAM